MVVVVEPEPGGVKIAIDEECGSVQQSDADHQAMEAPRRRERPEQTGRHARHSGGDPWKSDHQAMAGWKQRLRVNHQHDPAQRQQPPLEADPGGVLDITAGGVLRTRRHGRPQGVPAASVAPAIADPTLRSTVGQRSRRGCKAVAMSGAATAMKQTASAGRNQAVAIPAKAARNASRGRGCARKRAAARRPPNRQTAVGVVVQGSTQDTSANGGTAEVATKINTPIAAAWRVRPRSRLASRANSSSEAMKQARSGSRNGSAGPSHTKGAASNG